MRHSTGRCPRRIENAPPQGWSRARTDLPDWALTADEQRVADAARTGSLVDLISNGQAGRGEAAPPCGDGEDGGGCDGETTHHMSRGTVRAEWLVDLLSGRTTVGLHPRGLRLRAALLTGRRTGRPGGCWCR